MNISASSARRPGTEQESPASGQVPAPQSPRQAKREARRESRPNRSRELSAWEDFEPVRRPGVRGWFRRHPRAMDALVCTAYLIIGLLNLPAAFELMGERGWDVLAAALGITAVLWFRRQQPLLVTAVVMIIEAVVLLIYPWHGAQMMGLWAALYCVGASRGLKFALPTAVVACGLAYAPYLRLEVWVDEHGLEDLWLNQDVSWQELMYTFIVFSMLICCTAAGIGAAVRRGRLHEREIVEWARRSHELAQAGERNRIAREMHDVVAHSLSVMISLADGARVVVRKDPQRAGEVLEALSSTGRTALADMRRVIGVLRQGNDPTSSSEEKAPAHLVIPGAENPSRRPAGESLEELYEGFRQAGLPLTVTISGPPLPEDTAFRLTVHRIIQESLTNVLRYGRQVTEVEVRIEHIPQASTEEVEKLRERGLSELEQAALGMNPAGQVVITVTDDGLPVQGPPITGSVGSGQGLRGMSERAAFYNGSVYAGPGQRRGWLVRAVLEPPSCA